MPSMSDGLTPAAVPVSANAPENVSVTTVRPWASMDTVGVKATLPVAPPGPVRASVNAAALALPPANVTGPENVTVSDRTTDRWAAPSLTATDWTAGAATVPASFISAY